MVKGLASGKGKERLIRKGRLVKIGRYKSTFKLRGVRVKEIDRREKRGEEQAALEGNRLRD